MGQARQSAAVKRIGALQRIGHKIALDRRIASAQRNMLARMIHDRQSLINKAVAAQTRLNTQELERLCDELNGTVQLAREQLGHAQAQRDNTLAHVADLRKRLDARTVDNQNLREALDIEKRRQYRFTGWVILSYLLIAGCTLIERNTGGTVAQWVQSLF